MDKFKTFKSNLLDKLDSYSSNSKISTNQPSRTLKIILSLRNQVNINKISKVKKNRRKMLTGLELRKLVLVSELEKLSQTQNQPEKLLV